EAEDVVRSATVTVRYLDEQGAQQTMTTGGLLAIAIQHETDHLNGVMFVDHVSTLKREVIRKKMKKLQASMAEDAADQKPAAKKPKSKGAEAR
ncbi:MAG: peptide deformylase, partial [Archangium sp.]|nr:peptide deformylase [Archangium sp.]